MKNQIRAFVPQLGVVLSQIEKEYKKYTNNEMEFFSLSSIPRTGRVARLYAIVKGEQRTDDTRLELAINKVMDMPAYKGTFARVNAYFGYVQDVTAIAENEVNLAKIKAEKQAKIEAEKQAKEQETEMQTTKTETQDVPQETKAKKAKKVKA